ncbi:MAG: hypothetical protein KC912_16470 [Proteobacteria bacterium]|nr:hypothetical protein [Pseudomonadota bacterium]
MEDPTKSDTPPDHTVLGLRIEADLLPEWFDAVKAVGRPLYRRMAVIEKPEEWIVRIELPDEKVAQFNEEMEAAWAVFVEGRRAEGRWPE